jgi:hypothetical protein
MRLSRKVGGLVRIDRHMPLYKWSPEVEIIEVREESGCYLVRGKDGLEAFMGPMEFEANPPSRFDRKDPV